MKKVLLLSAGLTLFLMGCGNSRHKEEEVKEEQVPDKTDTTAAGRDLLLDSISKSLLDTNKK